MRCLLPRFSVGVWFTGLAAGLLVACPAIVRAAPITGTLSLVGSVRLTAAQEDFPPFAPVAGGGTANVVAPDTGSFALLTGKIADLKDLDNAATGPVIDFVTFAADPLVRIDLTSLQPGIFSPTLPAAPAAGQTYSPAGSIFNFTNLTGTSSTLSFQVLARTRNGSTGEIAPAAGVFTMQFADRSFQDVVAAMNTGSGVQSSFSAEFTTAPVPEPSGALVVLLLAPAGMTMRRRLRAVR